MKQKNQSYKKFETELTWILAESLRNKWKVYVK